MKLATPATFAVVLLGAGISLSARSAHTASLSHLVDRTAAAHPNALWHIVHDLCVTDMKARGHPAPCAIVDLAGGYAVLKDIQGATQYLLLPTARVTGIESPALLAPASPNYWQAAWSVKPLFERKIGHPVPREDLGLAVNSQYGRTQNQLHIHIDCVRADVRDALAQHEAEITDSWSSVTLGRWRRIYQARWINDSDLATRDPFKLLAESDPIARTGMAMETLILVGATRPDGSAGFVLLSHRAVLSIYDDAAGEELLDHKCGVLAAPPPAPPTTPAAPAS